MQDDKALAAAVLDLVAKGHGQSGSFGDLDGWMQQLIGETIEQQKRQWQTEQDSFVSNT